MFFYKILVAIFVLSQGVQNIASSDISEIKHNFFNNNMEYLYNVTDKLFTNLNICKKFSKSIQLLLAMHKDVVTAVENNYKACKLKHDTDNKKYIQDYDVVDIALKDANIILFHNEKKSINKLIDENLFIDVPRFLKQFQKSFAPQLGKNTSHHVNESDTSMPKSPGDSAIGLAILYKTEMISNKDNVFDTHEFTANTNNKWSRIAETECTTNNYTNDTVRKEIRNNVNRKPIILKTWVPVPDSKENITINNRRIFGGSPTSIRKYPFMASIHVDDQFVCAGSIIWKSLVVTAASCLQEAYINRHRNPPSNITVRIAGDSTTGGLLIPIARVYFNPLYNPDTLTHNLAVLKMRQHVDMKNTVRKVLYDRSGKPFPKDVKGVKILGWGAKDENNNYPEKLSTSFLDVYDKDECMKVYSKYYVADSNFCAGTVAAGSGACRKDIGDPAIINGVLVGLVSFGPPLCGTPDAPTVFTKIGVYSSWLDSIVQRELQGLADKRVKMTRQKKYSKKEEDKPTHSKSYIGRTGNSNGYPDEALVLKELLKHIDTANQSKIEELIEEGFKKELIDTSRFSIQEFPVSNLEIPTDPYPYYHDYIQNSMTQKTGYSTINENVIKDGDNLLNQKLNAGSDKSSLATIFPHKIKLYQNHNIQENEKLTKMRDVINTNNYENSFSIESNKLPSVSHPTRGGHQSFDNYVANDAKETALKGPIFDHVYGSAEDYYDKGLSIEVNTNRNDNNDESTTRFDDTLSKPRDDNLFFMFEASFEGPSIPKKTPVRNNPNSKTILTNKNSDNEYDVSKSFRSDEEDRINDYFRTN